MLVRVIHSLLTFLMLWALYKSGCRISRIRDLSFKAMTMASWPGILAFTLNEGLRFGRGIDYNVYASNFYDNPSSVWGEYEPIFRTIIVFLKDNSLPFQCLVMLMSFTLIVSLTCFIRNFREAAPWGLPAFGILFSGIAENLMRWFFGASLLFIGFSFLLKEEDGWKKKMVIFTFFSVASVLVHYGLFVMPIAYYLLSIPKRPLLNPWMAISLFFLVGMYFQTEMMLALTDYLNVFSLVSERAEGYVDKAERWLTGGADSLIVRVFPPMLATIVYCVSVWLGYRLVKVLDTHRYTVLYNLFSVGFVLIPVGMQVEIGLRYQQLLVLYQFVVCGYALKYLGRRNGILVKDKRVSMAVFLFYMGFAINFCVRRPFVTPEYTQLYVWNSGWKKYLDVEKTYIKDAREMQRRSMK